MDCQEKFSGIRIKARRPLLAIHINGWQPPHGRVISGYLNKRRASQSNAILQSSLPGTGGDVSQCALSFEPFLWLYQEHCPWASYLSIANLNWWAFHDRDKLPKNLGNRLSLWFYICYTGKFCLWNLGKNKVINRVAFILSTALCMEKVFKNRQNFELCFTGK